MKNNSLLGFAEDEMVDLAVRMGEPAFRGRQLYRQLYQRKQLDFEAMTDLPKGFRSRLAAEISLDPPAVHRRQEAADGTIKFLFRLQDGQFVETVYIPEERRDTLCISSQVGCDVGCRFCLTAQMGFRRNLRPGEIVGQVMGVIRAGVLQRPGFNIVFMGMGEPLYNYQNLMKAFRILTDPAGMSLSHRKITVSTSGVVPVLHKLAEESVVPNLAISLNATTDEQRSDLMPLNRRWNLEALLQACREFPLEPRRRITFEYILLAGVTDSDADARRLSRLLAGLKAKVNLIPYNVNPGLPFGRPGPDRIERFRQILEAAHLSAFVRRTRGDDISAACGQLAYLKTPEFPPPAGEKAGVAEAGG